jgi:protein-tyrosine phosphatase
VAQLFDKVLDYALAAIGVDLNFRLDAWHAGLSQISNDLYLGACPQPEHLAHLQSLGITHVVSALRATDRAKVAFIAPHFQTLQLNLDDSIQQDLVSVLPGFLDFIGQAQSSHPLGRVLIHCEAGVSRSASLVIALMMQRHKLSFFDAYRMVQAKRPQALPNLGFASQLQGLERHWQPTPGNRSSSLARYLHEVCQVPVELPAIESMLQAHDYDAMRALQAIFGADIPRVIQGLRH